MSRQLQVRIYPDGRIESKTLNVKGKQCEKYLNVMERLTDARVVDSEYTPEYYENEVILEEQNTIYLEEQS